jgi:hypothetical protein
MPVLEFQDTGFKGRRQQDLIILCDGGLAREYSTFFPGPYPALAASPFPPAGSENFYAVPYQYLEQVLSGFGVYKTC